MATNVIHPVTRSASRDLKTLQGHPTSRELLDRAPLICGYLCLAVAAILSLTIR